MTKSRKPITSKKKTSTALIEAADKLAKTPRPKKQKAVEGRKPSLLDHAAAVLAKSTEPMTTHQIVEKVLASTDQ